MTADSSKMSVEGIGPRSENEFVRIQTTRADHKLQDQYVLYDISVKPVFDLGAFKEVKRESTSLLDEGSRDKQPVEDIFDVEVRDGRLIREMTMHEAHRHAEGELTKGRSVTEPCAEEVEKWPPGDENASNKNHREGQADTKCAIEQRHQEASIIMSGKKTVCGMSGFDRATPNDYDKQMVHHEQAQKLYIHAEKIPRVGEKGEKKSATMTVQDYVAIKRAEWKYLVLVDDRGPRKLLHNANQEHWIEILERWKEFSELKKHTDNIEWDEDKTKRHKKVRQRRLKVDELHLLLVDSDEGGVPRRRKHRETKDICTGQSEGIP